MLAADKDRLIANVKQTALQLRQKELEYYVERYSNLATQASILAGFAFDGLVELDVSAAAEHEKWFKAVFYTAGSCTMAFSMYTLCVASFATVYGHRLALQGPTGSVERAVAVMMKSRNSIFVSFALALLCLIIAASAMAWVKMGRAAAAVTAVFTLLFLLLLWKHQQMKYAFRIDPQMMVCGDVRLQVGVTDVDVATLEAGAAAGLYSDRTTDGGGVNFAPGPGAGAAWGMPNGRSLDGGAGVGGGGGSGGGPSLASRSREPLLLPTATTATRG